VLRCPTVCIHPTPRGSNDVRLAVLKAAPIGAGVVAFGLSGGTALAADPQAQLQGQQEALQSQFAQGQAQLQSQKEALQSQLAQGPSQLSAKQAQAEQTPSQLSAKQAQYEALLVSQANGTNQGLRSMAPGMNAEPKKKHHDYDSDSGQNAHQSQKSDQKSSSKSEQNGSPTINVNALNFGGKSDQSGNHAKNDSRNYNTQQQLASQVAGGEKPHPWMSSVHPWGHDQVDP
jgi:hypothetical protein